MLLMSGEVFSMLSSRKRTVYVAFFLLIFFLFGIKFFPAARAQHVLLIVVFSLLFFSAAITYAFVYLFEFSEKTGNEGNYISIFKNEFGLAAIVMIVMLPLLTEPFLYFDDWWTVGSNIEISKDNLLMFGRPIQTLIALAMDFVNIQNAYLSKWIFLPAIILYAIILYRWVNSKTHDNVLSFTIAAILAVFAPVVDLLGYTSTSAFVYSVLFSALSVPCFEYAWNLFRDGQKKYSYIGAAFSFALLLAALLVYQIGPQIVFLLLSIEIYFSEHIKGLLKKYISFLFLYVGAYGSYMLFMKFLNRIYHVGITTNRSQIINSLPQIFEKISFYKMVFIQSIMQAIAALSANSLLMERYHGYFVSLSDNPIGVGLFSFVIIVIIAAFVGYWLRTRSLIGIVMLLLFIPSSDFVFLVLSESGYLTYYAFAHISLIMFYFIMGLATFARFIWVIVSRLLDRNSLKDVDFSFFLVPLLIVCALVSNYYARDFYVNYNSIVYNFVKYTLQTTLETGEIKRIHIVGLISPLNADVYSRFVLETALRDLGDNPSNYQITFSRNWNFLARIQETDYLQIKKNLSESDAAELDSYYFLDPTYRQYYIKSPPSIDDQLELKRIFMSAGTIPQASSPNTLIIDLSWTDKAYYNHSR
jgi:hypothetical protein